MLRRGRRGDVSPEAVSPEARRAETVTPLQRPQPENLSICWIVTFIEMNCPPQKVLVSRSEPACFVAAARTFPLLNLKFIEINCPPRKCPVCLFASLRSPLLCLETWLHSFAKLGCTRALIRDLSRTGPNSLNCLQPCVTRNVFELVQNFLRFRRAGLGHLKCLVPRNV